MAQMIRVYLKRAAAGDCRTFFGKAVKRNIEPGWPGDHHVEFELSQFYEDIPVLKNGIRAQIENSPEFVGASITTPARVMSESLLKEHQSYTFKGTGITVDTSERPYLITIWSMTIADAMEQMKHIVPADP